MSVDEVEIHRPFRMARFIVLAVALLALLSWLTFTATHNKSKVNELTKSAAAQQALIDKLAAVIDTANKKGADVPTPEQVATQVPGADVSPVAGPQGERGDAGDPGPQGDTGATGSIGPTGPGPTGDQIMATVIAYCRSDSDPCRGPTGSTGSAGPAGVNGADGAPGRPGFDGANGVDGARGPQGPQGPIGPQGSDGATGSQGPQGRTPQTMDCTQDFFDPTLFHCTVTS